MLVYCDNIPRNALTPDYLMMSDLTMMTFLYFIILCFNLSVSNQRYISYHAKPKTPYTWQYSLLLVQFIQFSSSGTLGLSKSVYFVLNHLIPSFLLVHFILKVINTISAACHSLTAVSFRADSAVMLVTDSSFSSCDCVCFPREGNNQTLNSSEQTVLISHTPHSQRQTSSA